MNLENRQLEEQMREIRRNIAGLLASMEELEAENTARNEAITSDGVLLEAARNQREKASRAFSQIQLEAAGLKQQDSFLDQNLSRLEEETGRLLAEQKALDSGSGDSEQAVKERLLEIEAIKQQICAVQEEAGTFMKEAEGARQEKEALGAGQKDFFARREALSDRLSRLDKELFRLQGQKEKQEEKRDSSVEYMWSEYELTRDRLPRS